MFKRSVFFLIAIHSIAASATADARPGYHKQHRIAHETIVCNDRGCSDFRSASRYTPRAVETRAERRIGQESRHESHREIRQRVHHARGGREGGSAVIVCNHQGCSDRVLAARARNAMASIDARQVIDANGNGIVVGDRPTGCPHAFCGCEASRYVFGEMRPDLYLASNWIRKFPRTSPAPGMAAARSGHVMILISHVGGNDWMVHDGNSGGGKTRDHIMSISRYIVVDPRGSRSARQ